MTIKRLGEAHHAVARGRVAGQSNAVGADGAPRFHPDAAYIGRTGSRLLERPAPPVASHHERVEYVERVQVPLGCTAQAVDTSLQCLGIPRVDVCREVADALFVLGDLILLARKSKTEKGDAHEQ